MTDKLWKQAERKLAEILGGRRVPVTGRQRGSAPDVEHKRFSIEVKHRENLPDWILDAMNQADESNNGSQISVVLLHQKGMAYTESLAVIRVKDLAKLDKQE
jgi:hypothetical protein